MAYRYTGDDRMLGKVYDVLAFTINLFAMLLGIRFVLMLLGARASGFAGVMYQLSEPLVAPFKGIFPSLQMRGAEIETASLLAIVVLYLVGYLIAQLLGLFARDRGVDEVVTFQ